MSIRRFEERDRGRLKAITAEVFGPAAVDYYIERRFGFVRLRDWRWRKVRHIDDDVRVNAGGIFVYEERAPSGQDILLGYVSVQLDRDAGIGRIANLAVTAQAQSRGVGRALLDHALAYIEAQNMVLARVETLVGNAAGEHLYPALGFEEVARQIYYVKRLREERSVRPLLYVVSRDRLVLFERLQQEFAEVPHVEVVVDRRRGERRRKWSIAGVDRRQRERRHREVNAELSQLGCALVPRS